MDTKIIPSCAEARIAELRLFHFACTAPSISIKVEESKKRGRERTIVFGKSLHRQSPVWVPDVPQVDISNSSSKL